MPISREFVYEEDEDTGYVGLRPTWLRNANPTAGVAHDMLEHFVDPRCNSAEAEFMALGAVLALRIEQGVFSNYRSHEDQLANLIFSVLQDIERDDLELPPLSTSRRLADEYEWADSLILAAVPTAFRLHRSELAHHQGLTSDLAAEHLPPTLACQKQLQTTIVALVRRGYRRVWRRYAGVDLFTLGQYTFKKLDAFSKRIVDSELLSFGDRVRINVDRTGRSFTASVNGFPFHF